jgi:hypothetical protein
MRLAIGLPLLGAACATTPTPAFDRSELGAPVTVVGRGAAGYLMGERQVAPEWTAPPVASGSPLNFEVRNSGEPEWSVEGLIRAENRRGYWGIFERLEISPAAGGEPWKMELSSNEDHQVNGKLCRSARCYELVGYPAIDPWIGRPYGVSSVAIHDPRGVVVAETRLDGKHTSFAARPGLDPALESALSAAGAAIALSRGVLVAVGHQSDVPEMPDTRCTGGNRFSAEIAETRALAGDEENARRGKSSSRGRRVMQRSSAIFNCRMIAEGRNE